MKALISPIEPRESGYRVAQVSEQEFLIAQPFFWIECADHVIADQYWFDPEDQTIKLLPETVPQSQPISTGAQDL
jgi:hypothetical protein